MVSQNNDLEPVQLNRRPTGVAWIQFRELVEVYPFLHGYPNEKAEREIASL